MSKNSFPPLLRGIGTTVVLLGAVIGFLAARHDIQTPKTPAPAAAEENFADEVLENPSFEWLGLIGTAIVAGSFYTEAFIRRKAGD